MTKRKYQATIVRFICLLRICFGNYVMVCIYFQYLVIFLIYKQLFLLYRHALSIKKKFKTVHLLTP